MSIGGPHEVLPPHGGPRAGYRSTALGDLIDRPGPAGICESSPAVGSSTSSARDGPRPLNAAWPVAVFLQAVLKFGQRSVALLDQAEYVVGERNPNHDQSAGEEREGDHGSSTSLRRRIAVGSSRKLPSAGSRAIWTPSSCLSASN